MVISGRTFLVTGGTGSLGRTLTRKLLNNGAKRIIAFSRDEGKHRNMLLEFEDSRVECFVGDVRDLDRLRRAAEASVDVIIHAAAMKDVPLSERNPFEAVATNVIGTENVVTAALEAEVEKVIGVSTDKAASPCNLYGATKLVSEKLLCQGNAYSGHRKTRFACVRYGNVVDSRGSVLQLFSDLARREERLLVTHPEMTRFWMTLTQAADVVLSALSHMQGGELFIPNNLRAFRVVDLVYAIASDYALCGIRPGEKMHECLLTTEEARHSAYCPPNFIIVLPEVRTWEVSQTWKAYPAYEGGSFSSNSVPLISTEEIRKFLNTLSLAEEH